MFKAFLLSLNDGQSFKYVDIYEDGDFDKHNIPKMFGDLTCCVYADNKLLILHSWTIRMIQLNQKYIKCSKCFHSPRLVLDGDASFSPATIIQSSNLANYNIPIYFDPTDDLGGQCTFSCNEGTFITHATNVAYLVYDGFQSKSVTPQILKNK